MHYRDKLSTDKDFKFCALRLLALDGGGLHPDGDDGAHAARHLVQDQVTSY